MRRKVMSVDRKGVRHVDDGKGCARCGAGLLTLVLRPEEEIAFACPQCFSEGRRVTGNPRDVWNERAAPGARDAWNERAAPGARDAWKVLTSTPWSDNARRAEAGSVAPDDDR